MKLNFIAIVVSIVFLAGCGNSEKKNQDDKSTSESEMKVYDNPLDDKGIGPVTSLTLPKEINQELAAKGKEIYVLKCTACHKETQRFIGPAPVGIFERRSPEWVMNMILNPEEMVQKNAIAKQLLAEYIAPMANQNLTEDEARAVVEYFRTIK
ncbi:MAG: c-type cytochrome [Flavobacteriaceae bacterium]|nr:c-type cytochrome [Flavobacteriaceae bacterium]